MEVQQQWYGVIIYNQFSVNLSNFNFFQQSSVFARCSTDEIDYTTPVYNTLGHYRTTCGSYADNSGNFTDSDDVFLTPTKKKTSPVISATMRPATKHSSASKQITSSTTTTTNTRRHSIGSFIAKEKTRTGSVSDEVPKMPAPKPPTYNVGARLKDHFKMGKSIYLTKFILNSFYVD